VTDKRDHILTDGARTNEANTRMQGIDREAESASVVVGKKRMARREPKTFEDRARAVPSSQDLRLLYFETVTRAIDCKSNERVKNMAVTWSNLTHDDLQL